MNRWAEIAELQANPDGRGGYAVQRESYHTSVSDEGLQRMIDDAHYIDAISEQLDIARLAKPACEHGMPLTSDRFVWRVNDYVDGMDVGRWVMLTLDETFHEDGEPCFPLHARVWGNIVAVQDDYV